MKLPFSVCYDREDDINIQLSRLSTSEELSKAHQYGSVRSKCYYICMKFISLELNIGFNYRNKRECWKNSSEYQIIKELPIPEMK
jgi:hypothetical protein